MCSKYADFMHFGIGQSAALSYGQRGSRPYTCFSLKSGNNHIGINPTAGQDFYHYNEIMSFLIELNRQGKTIIMITNFTRIYCLSIVQEQLYYQRLSCR